MRNDGLYLLSRLGEWERGSMFCMMVYSVTQDLCRFNPVACPDFPGGCAVLTILTRPKNDTLSRYIKLASVFAPHLLLYFPIELLHLNLILRKKALPPARFV